LRFNDGTAVPPALLAGTVVEIERHFGAASWESQVIEGIWHQGGIEFRDQLNRVFVDARDTPENRRFFTDPNSGSRPVSSSSTSGSLCTRSKCCSA